MFKKKKPAFERQDVVEEDILEDEVVDDEGIEEGDLKVPQPQPQPRTIDRRMVMVPKPKVQPQVQQVQEEVKPDWKVEEIPTQTQPVIYNSRTKKVYTLEEAVAEILNRSED